MGRDAGMIIGETHLVCQDYARTMEAKGDEWAFVADGCSSSPDTDIGARLMVLLAMQSSQLPEKDISTPMSSVGLFMAQGIAKQLCLHPHSLDATLLAIKTEREPRSVPVEGGFQAGKFGFTFYVAGDGVYGVKKKDGTIMAAEVKYENNVPYYLNYNMDDKRHASFESGKGKVLYFQRSPKGKWKDKEACFWRDKESFFWPAEPGDIAFICTDGVSSVFKRVTNGTSKTIEQVPLTQVLDRVLDFKGQGQFVCRRLRRFQKEMRKNDWFNNDDIAVAAVEAEVLNEDQGGE